jgi:hypothetical protein
MSGAEPQIVAALLERVNALEEQSSAYPKALAEHELADAGRHREVMEVLPAIKALLAEVREGQRRTVAAWLSELGADPVPLPVVGPLKVRTIVVLVVLGLGSATWLGISGESIWAWWTGQPAAAEEQPAPDAEEAP